MIEYDKIKFAQLKQVVMLLNGTGSIEPTLRHVGVKGPKLYDNFIKSVESLTQEQQESLPEKIIDFFNYAVKDEEAESEAPELNFDDDAAKAPADPEPVIEEEDEQSSPIDQEIIPTPVIGRRRGVKKEPETVKQDEPPKQETDLSKNPTKKVIRLANIIMSPKVENSKLTITFKELNISKTFKLPQIENIAALKPVRKEAMDFASENGATKGQLCNISKTLNQAGYYSR